MADKRLLLLSNSTNAGGTYLEYPREEIRAFLGGKVRRVLFIPYAAVRISYERYAGIVGEAFGDMGFGVEPIHTVSDPKSAVAQAEAIVIGGGNSFHLLYYLYAEDILDGIRARVLDGIPYIGWSAGANIACPTMRTTNDMPIVEPPSLVSLNLVPFQVNPHYIDTHPPDHAGETRDERLAEFIEVNRETTVIGLREGTMLHVEGDTIRLTGGKPARIFKYASEPVDTMDVTDITG